MNPESVQTARVFLPILSSRFDLTAAARFGPVSYLLQTEDRSPFQTDALIGEFLEKLQADRYEPSRDFVALTGPSIFCALLLAVVVARYRKVRTLLFHAASGRYVERIINADNWSELAP